MRREYANWLHRHADQPRDRSVLRFLQNVNPAMIDGRTWSTASNAKMILAVDDRGQLVHDVIPRAGFERFRPVLEELLSRTADCWFETTLPDLWDWVAFSRRGVCDECRTLLADELDDGCNTCDQGGFVEAEELRLGLIGGAVVDVERLLYALPPELLDFGGVDGSQLCRIGSSQRNNERYFFAWGDRWRVLMMGHRQDEGMERLQATAPLYHPGVGPMWHARHHPIGRLVLADWYEENGEPGYAAQLREHEPPW